MMRISSKLWATIAFVAIVAMVSQVAVAQNEKGQRGRGGRGGGPGGPGGRGGPVSMARLATIDTVQAALKLKDEQKSKIEKINNESRDEMRKVYQDGGRPDPEKMQKMMESTSAKLNEVLDEGQQKRLMGILIQVNGAGAVNDPAVAKALTITDEQKTKLRESMRGLREAGGENQSPEEMRAKRDKAVMAVLTTEQQQKLESLKGEKVDIDMSKLRGPGGGRQGRGERRERPNRDSNQSNEKKAA